MQHRVINLDSRNNPQHFKSFINEDELADVTLVCDDGDITAHKLILYSGSEFFRLVLKKSKHQHPLLYMKGFKKDLLKSIVDFLYVGEVEVDEDDLPDFFMS